MTMLLYTFTNSYSRQQNPQKIDTLQPLNQVSFHVTLGHNGTGIQVAFMQLS